MPRKLGFQKRHYEFLARTILDARSFCPAEQRHEFDAAVIGKAAAQLSADSPEFSYSRFADACRGM